jgi:uncharacterized lipoprotein
MTIIARRTVESWLAAVLAASVVLVLAGCQQVDRVDTGEAEQDIKRGLSARTGAKLRSVDCPDDVEARKGDVFTCTAIASDGSKVRVKVTQVDDEGGVRWELGR